MAVISPYSFADLRAPRPAPVVKRAVYQDLIDQGFPAEVSWEDGTVPSALIETEARALANFEQARKVTLDSGFNEWAVGDALTEHSRQVYLNGRRPGRRAVMRLTLTDGGAGPFTFDPTSVSWSVGAGGLLFDGIQPPPGAREAPGLVTLPLNGSVKIWVQAAEPGAAYNVGVGRVDTPARGVLPGVTATNPADALSAPGATPGADAEVDLSLRARNRAQWATLGTGSPRAAYEKRARDADVLITRVEVFRNVDPLDPGCVTVVIAGDAGALPPQVVLAAQNALAPNQVGGDFLPETARVVVSSAVNISVPVSGTLFVPGDYNTPAFQAQVAANLLALEKAYRIGAKLSAGRLKGAAVYVAGLDPGVVVTVSDDFVPGRDVQLPYYGVGVLDISALRFVSV